MRTSEVLNLAADAIQERGWRKGPGGWETKSDSGLCLEGGIAAAMGLRIDNSAGDDDFKELQNCPAYEAVAQYLGTTWVWVWNDQDAKSAERVIEVLRAAALIEEARENQSIKNEIKEEVSA